MPRQSLLVPNDYDINYDWSKLIGSKLSKVLESLKSSFEQWQRLI